MVAKINSYFAILLITISGAVAAFIIVHVAYSSAFAIGYYSPFEQSLLRN